MHDVRTLHDLITSFAENKIKSGFIVFDRGITSGKNLKDLKNLDWEVVCGMALHSGLKQLLRALIRKDPFVRFENRVRLNKSIFYVIIQPYELEGINGTLAWCFNEPQKGTCVNRATMNSSMRNNSLSKINPSSRGWKVFDAQENYGTPGCGMRKSLMATPVFLVPIKSPKRRCYGFIFGDKDIVEKAFHSLKGVVNLQPIRHWLYNRVTAHVFI